MYVCISKSSNQIASNKQVTLVNSTSLYGRIINITDMQRNHAKTDADMPSKLMYYLLHINFSVDRAVVFKKVKVKVL